MAPLLPVTIDTYRSCASDPRRSLQSRVRVASPYPPTHHGPQRETDAITLILMHCTADTGTASDDGADARAVIAYLNTTTEKTGTYHYVIARCGLIYRMCAASLVAYHAGDSAWPDPQPYPPGNVYRDEDGDVHHHTVNGRSLGIAWCNRDDGTEALTRAQVESALWLCGVYVPTTGVQRVEHVIGHRECSPGRKVDPVPAVMPMDTFRELVRLYLRSDP